MDRAVVVVAVVAAALAGCLGDGAPGPGVSTASREPAEASSHSAFSYGPGLDRSRNVSSGAEPWSTLVGIEGGEPTIAAPHNGTLLVTTVRQTVQSTDGGDTWGTVLDYARDRDEPTLGRGGDPWMAMERSTGRIYVMHLNSATKCPDLFVSEDAGDAWEHRGAACAIPVADHPKLGVGPPGPDTNPLVETGTDHVLYMCSNKGVGTSCSASYDDGETWPVASAIPHPPTSSCGGINGPVTVGPDGTAVLGMSLECEVLRLGVSTDSGASWTSRKGPPGPGAQGQDPGIDFDEAGNLYVAWRGDDQRLYLARTEDGGRTWAGPWRASPPGVTSTFFHVLESGDEGRIALTTIGSTETTGRADQAAEGTAWHLYVVTSTDAHTDQPTFTAYRVTPEGDPVQSGCVQLDEARCPRNMLDFIGDTQSPDGSYSVAYTDGCVDACRNGSLPDQSTAEQIAVAGLRNFSLTGP